MRRFTDRQRRDRMVRRHHLIPETAAATVEQATRGVVVLHATDPATVHLSALARVPRARPADVERAMYEERSLVRMLAMRRTLFVVPADRVAIVHHGASVDVATRMRARLLKDLVEIPLDPPIRGRADRWLARVEAGVEAALEGHGALTGAQLAEIEPRLRTAFVPVGGNAWDLRRNLTSALLTLMAVEGRIVRGRPAGSWVSRRHTWEPARSWLGGAIPGHDPDDARAALVGDWLARFGPAPVADIVWWTGWSQRTVRAALARLDTAAVTVADGEAVALADDLDDEPAAPPAAVLLPALDPTPMGWKHRDWFTPVDPGALYDRNGNIGPTVWWDGEIVGAWSARRPGGIVWRLLADRGREAALAVEAAAAELTLRIGGTPVVPSFPTPLERELGTA